MLRRIIRRAARHGHKLGASESFFHKLVAPLVNLMGEAFPELAKAQKQVEDALLAEEVRFAETLSQGMKIFEEDLSKLSGKTVPGETAFKLYDTYGFPLDLTADIARERGLSVDEAGFETHMEAQRDRARAASQFASAGAAQIASTTATSFTGYDMLEAQAEVAELFVDGQSVDSIDASGVSADQSVVIVLTETPFYGESGGQVGDRGLLSNDSVEFEVADTQKSGAAFLHFGVLAQGSISKGDKLSAAVDADRRRATLKNHSATHLLHAGLRRVLGEHVQQKGSLVGPGHLRFDFSHGAPVSHEELTTIESWVNGQVMENAEASTNEMSMDDAIAKGAMALFGEKYGDVVRVVELGPDSVELCGGTHVRRCGDIGMFRIVGETGVAAGVRRIEAVTGTTAIDQTLGEHNTLASIAARLKSPLEKVDERVAGLSEQNRELSREIDRLKSVIASHAGDSLSSDAVDINGVKVLAIELKNTDAKGLRDSMDKLKDKLGTAAIVLAAVEEGKVRLIAGVSKDVTDQVKAGELVNHVALQVGGKGGGRPDLAQAGGTQPENLSSALASVTDWVTTKL